MDVIRRPHRWGHHTHNLIGQAVARHCQVGGPPVAGTRAAVVADSTGKWRKCPSPEEVLPWHGDAITVCANQLPTNGAATPWLDMRITMSTCWPKSLNNVQKQIGLSLGLTQKCANELTKNDKQKKARNYGKQNGDNKHHKSELKT